MDRPIDPRELNNRKLKKTVVACVIAAAVIAGGMTARALLHPTLSANQIRTATVDRGPVEAATLCSGTVLPEMEQIVPCPFPSRVLRVLEKPGAEVTEGQALVALDDSEVRLEVARLEDQVALKENHRLEMQLGLDSRLTALEGEIEIKRERLRFLETKTEQQQSLHELGLSSIHDLRQAELNEKIARIELRQLAESVDEERASTAARVQGLDIEMSLLRRSLDDQRRRLSRATIRADRDGVVTWITTQEGANLLEGAEVARVADLSRFKVEASVSDLHVGRFSVGLPVRVVAGETTLDGRVSSIPPAIDKGIMTLNISLDEADHTALRANLRVDVHVVTASRPDTLRIAKGPFVTGPGEQDIFVVGDGQAQRIRARIGVAGIEFFELLSGPAEGDTVIISNMSEHRHLERLRIR